jgi:transposase-like protein
MKSSRSELYDWSMTTRAGTPRSLRFAREIGVGEALLGRWVAIERSRMDDPPAAVDANERAELVRLRRKAAELRMDRSS